MITQFISNPNVLNIYRFGSFVYKTNNINSDNDYIVVVNEMIESPSIDIHIHTVNSFQLSLNNMDIQMLECYFLPQEHILKETVKFEFTLDKQKLRKSISTVANGSWVKGKKKLIVNSDYNKYLAIKSIFHSLRILDIGIQIGTENRITDFSRMNWILFDLLKISENKEHTELWDLIETKYKSTFNELSSMFKSICPKPLNENDYILQLKKMV